MASDLRRCGHPLGPSAHCSECTWEEYRKGPPLVSLHSPRPAMSEPTKRMAETLGAQFVRKGAGEP